MAEDDKKFNNYEQARKDVVEYLSKGVGYLPLELDLADETKLKAVFFGENEGTPVGLVLGSTNTEIKELLDLSKAPEVTADEQYRYFVSITREGLRLIKSQLLEGSFSQEVVNVIESAGYFTDESAPTPELQLGVMDIVEG